MKTSEKITKIIRELSIKDLEEKFTENFSTKTILIMPIFNEEKIVSETIKNIFDFDKNLAIIAINDGSTDNSLLILKNLQKKYTNLFVTSHSQNLGQ